jgi:hypothetical protein
MCACRVASFVSYVPGVELPEYVMCVNVIIHAGLVLAAAASAHAFAWAEVTEAYIPCL